MRELKLFRLLSVTLPIGNYFSNSSRYQFYPALYLLRKNFSNIRENVSDFENNIVAPTTRKLEELSADLDEQYREITAFTQTKNDEIQQQFDDKVDELKEFQDSIDNWQEEKQNRIKELEETYNAKLSLEAPEKLWNDRLHRTSETSSKLDDSLNCCYYSLNSILCNISACSLRLFEEYHQSYSIHIRILYSNNSYILLYLYN